MSSSIEVKVLDNPWGESIEEAISKGYIKRYEYKNFKNITEISSGNFGKIYSANWKDTHKLVALKYLKDVTEKEILREFKLQREFDFHDNVHLHGITNFSLDSKINIYMLVMEYTDGGTLRDYLKKNFDNFTGSDKLQLALQLAHAVARLHDERISHHDLHSGSLFVRQHTIKLADFGLLRRASKAYTGMIPYIDPKILSKRKNVSDTNNEHSLNEKSDVYSIGVLLWEISSGRPPFDTTGELCDIGLALEILQGLRETPIPNTPDDYVQLYTECWSDDPNKRPSMKEVVRRLKVIISQTNTENQQSDKNLNDVTNHDQNFNNDNENNKNGEIPLESIMIDKIVDGIFKLINGGNDEDEIKNHIINYIDSSSSNLQKIYSWIVTNTDKMNSIFTLGYFSFYGIGKKINLDKAFALFINAAEENHLLAQYFVGLCYELGHGTEKNGMLAFNYYKKLAEADYPIGEHKVGFFYEEGISIKRDSKMAAFWYKKAIANGNMIAQFNLAKMYKNGDGLEKDYDKAFEMFKQIAEKGISRGISMLGYCYYHGVGTNVDHKKALELYQKAANLGNSVAQYNLANIYENGDVEKAIYWYKKSAEQGYPNAQIRLEKFKNYVGDKYD